MTELQRRNNVMSIFEMKMAQYVELTEENLRKYNELSEANEPQKTLIEAMNYSLDAGGKRIRPALVLAFCEALGGDIQSAVAPACAIEMIHTSSLIHDDLPAVDNDDMRRGKPSCHKAYGEAAAVFAGDALEFLPFEIIADSQELTAEQKVLIMSVLANAAGKDGMLGGQMIDMENQERTDITEDELKNLYRCKTGQLIAVSCVMGAICADAGRENLRAAAEYGLRLGLAFQIIDDILDVTGNSEELGKPAGSDARQSKNTYVTLFGIEKAVELADKATSEALEWLDAVDDNSFLKELTEYLLRRKK